jgi:hypothetical protein
MAGAGIPPNIDHGPNLQKQETNATSCTRRPTYSLETTTAAGNGIHVVAVGAGESDVARPSNDIHSSVPC